MTKTLPGAGMSYQDLCDTAPYAEARLMWRALSSLADVLGISTIKAQIGARSLTVDELVSEIREVLPEPMDIGAAALATAAITGDQPTYTQRFEIQRLVFGATPDDLHYVTEETFDDFAAASEAKARWVEHLPGSVFALVGVEATVKATIYEPGYARRR